MHMAVTGRPGERVRCRPGERVRCRPGERVRCRPGERVRCRPGERVRGRPGERVRRRPGQTRATPRAGSGVLRRMDDLRSSESVVVACPPGTLYEMVSDVTRMGEWSPICRQCWWDEGQGPKEGAWFTGRNQTPERTWGTRSQVVAARPGQEFAFMVNGGRVRWGYTFEPVDGGTRLTESWEFLPAGLEAFRERYGDEAEAQVADRREAAHSGIPATLAAIKRAAEPG